jgi:thymidylate synthase (FAD)
VSARYTQLTAEWYVPDTANVTTKAKSNKQGRSEEQYEHAEAFRRLLAQDCHSAYVNYSRFLEEGVAPELCRLFLHVNHYTKWLWRQDLHNLLHFISLREDAHAQWEAQQYAKAVKELVRDVLPETIALYESMH